MDRKTAKTLAVLVTKSFNLYNTYGRDPAALGDIFSDFQEALAEYPEEKISLAFTEWRKTKSSMPTPADIIELIEGEKKLKETTQPYYRPFEPEVEVNDWSSLTPEQQAETKKLVEETMKMLGAGKKSERPRDDRPLEEILSEMKIRQGVETQESV